MEPYETMQPATPTAPVQAGMPTEIATAVSTAPESALEAGSPLATRDVHIDVLKGMGMLLVIMGHIQTVEFLGYGIIAYIYTFHMPLFFLLSGYLTSARTRSMGFGRFVAKRAKGLLLPYVFFFAFSLLWNETVYAISTGAPPFSFAYPLKEMLQAFSLAGEYLYAFALNLPLWFFPGLFFVSLVFYFLIKIPKRWVLLVVALALALAALPWQSFMKETALGSIWLLRLFPAVLFYMVLGYLLGSFKSEIKDFKNSLLGLFLLIIAVAMMPYGNGDIWNISSYLYFIGSLCSIIGLYLFAQESNNKIFAYIGRNSLYYLGLHALVGQLPWIEVDLPAYCEAHGYTGILAYLAYFVATVLLTTVLVVVIKGCQKGLLAAWHALFHKKRKPAAS